MSRTISCIAVALFAVAASFAGSTASADEQHSTFEGIDANGNGYITMDEAVHREDLRLAFPTVDKDKDGKINIKEFDAFIGKGRLTPPEEAEVPEIGAAPTE